MATATRTISIDTIRDASRAVYAAAVRTPLVRLDVPGDRRPATRTGEPVEVYLKLETLQPIGSFKIRGAYNAVRQLSPEELQRGVWTVSAGNAAQGVALAARLAGARCSVMVIDTAPEAKVQAIRRLGAEIVPVTWDEAWQTVERHGSERMDGVFIHPFDDDRFISGNGTVALEILEDLPDVDGIGCALRALRPQARVLASEPETAAPLAASLRAGEASVFPAWQASFVDGAGGKSVIPTMWPLLSQWVDGSIVVTLEEVKAAMRLAADRCHVIAEGAAGCAIAAALSGAAGGGKVVAVVSGGNIDLSRFASLVGAQDGAPSGAPT
jgi:threonine dehydratase